MRLIAARLRHFVGNRRSAPRYEARLVCRVALKARRAGANGARKAPMLEGQTRDLSATGISLLMPAIRLGDHYLTGEGSTLLIELELPDEVIQVQAVAVRYERLEEEGARSEYVIGTRITEMTEEARARFNAYLQSHKR